MKTSWQAKENNHYREALNRAIAAAFVLVLISGCASRKQIEFDEAFDQEAISAQISVAGPLDISGNSRRGVDVRVILPEAGNHGALNASNQVAINKMLKNGIRVYLFPGMSHVKAAVIDGWACVGSANFDKLSLKINKELNLGTSHEAAVNELLERVFIPDLARSKEINQEVDITLQARLLEILVDELL